MYRSMKPFITKEISDSLKAQWEAEERLFKDWLHQGQVFQDASRAQSMLASDKEVDDSVARTSGAKPSISQSVLLHQMHSFYEWVKTQGESQYNTIFEPEKTAGWQTHFNLRAAAASQVELPWYAIDMALTPSVHIVITPSHHQSYGEVDIHLRPVIGAQELFLDEFSGHRGRPLSLSIIDNGLPIIVSEGCVHPLGLSIEAEGYLLDTQRPIKNDLQLCIDYSV